MTAKTKPKPPKTKDVTHPEPVGRPTAPAILFDPENLTTLFVPAPELEAWARGALIEEGAPLVNEDHAHLRDATLGFLWTTLPNRRQGRMILGQAEVGQPRGTMGKWPMGRAEQQLVEWFEDVPDFVITIDASYSAQCTDAEFCALIDHELYHCGQDIDAFGQPKFTQEGRPKFAMRGHDVEEFVGIVRRYGADAAHVRELVEAAQGKPEIANVRISQACGTCLLRVA